MPSALSVSKAYSISRRLALDVRQRQRREMAEAALVVRCIFAAASLTSRAKVRDAAASPSHTLGVDTDSTDTAMPSLSIASMAWLGRQFFSRS